MVVKVKELEKWLRKLDEIDLVAGYIVGGELRLKAYKANAGAKDHPELEMN